MAETMQKDVRDRIVKHLEDDKRSLMWLHEETLIPYGTIYSCLTERRFNLSEENLKKINDTLGTDFK